MILHIVSFKSFKVHYWDLTSHLQFVRCFCTLLSKKEESTDQNYWKSAKWKSAISFEFWFNKNVFRNKTYSVCECTADVTCCQQVPVLSHLSKVHFYQKRFWLVKNILTDSYLSFFYDLVPSLFRFESTMDLASTNGSIWHWYTLTLEFTFKLFGCCGLSAHIICLFSLSSRFFLQPHAGRLAPTKHFKGFNHNST